MYSRSVIFKYFIVPASVHRHSQLKPQKLRVGSGYMEEVLKWFNYPHTRAHPGCEVAREYRIVALSMLCPVQPDSGENCTVLQSGPTRCLIAKFPQHSVVACQYASFVLQGNNTANKATGGCVQTFSLLTGDITWKSYTCMLLVIHVLGYICTFSGDPDTRTVPLSFIARL